MPIIGLSFNSVEAKKDKEQRIRDEVKINSVPRINDIKEITLSTIGSRKALSMDFEFETTYMPKVGEIKLTGELLYLSDQHKEILKQWEKERKIPEKQSLEIINYLFKKCLIKISNIAEDLQLPLPIPMPVVKPKPKGEKEEEK
jgi:hypothetical protein